MSRLTPSCCSAARSGLAGTEEALAHPGEDGDEEVAEGAARGVALAAGGGDELFEAWLDGGSIEAVCMAAGDRRQAGTETADDDRRRDVRAGEAAGAAEAVVLAVEVGGVVRPQMLEDVNGLNELLGADAVRRHRETAHGLLRGVGKLAAATGAEAQEQAIVRYLLDRGSHVGEEARMAIGDV